MHQIELHEAKQHLADFIDLALGGEEILITQDEQPVLTLLRVAAPKARRKAGSAKGLITMASDRDLNTPEEFAYLMATDLAGAMAIDNGLDAVRYAKTYLPQLWQAIQHRETR